MKKLIFSILLLLPICSGAQTIYTDSVTSKRVADLMPKSISWHSKPDFVSRVSVSINSISNGVAYYSYTFDYSRVADDNSIHWYSIEDGSGSSTLDKSQSYNTLEFNLFKYILSSYNLSFK